MKLLQLTQDGQIPVAGPSELVSGLSTCMLCRIIYYLILLTQYSGLLGACVPLCEHTSIVILTGFY